MDQEYSLTAQHRLYGCFGIYFLGHGVREYP